MKRYTASYPRAVITCLLTLGAIATATPTLSEPDIDSLAGTSWRLLNIASMDDTMDVPVDPNKYTLEFGDGDLVAMQLDCNRGTGSWKSEAANQLTFGPIAATRALCPPPSLGEKYLAQFEWVRTYTMRDGNLFLATMADGSIIEFEPLPPVVATVLGDDVRASSADELQEVILTRLFDSYAAENNLEVTDSEIAAYLKRMNEGMDAGEELSAEEAAEVDAMRRDMGNAVISQWKVNKSLYAAYGGRVIYQQFGPEPLDAYLKFLKEHEKAGDFTITDPDMEKAFWGYFTDESKHDFMAPGSDELKQAFEVAPWE